MLDQPRPTTPQLDEPPYDPEYDPQPTSSRREPRPIPADNNAERYVLGAALLDPKQIPIIAAALTPSDFWQPRHELIWRTIQHLHASDQPTQPQAVTAALVDAKQIDAAGGHLYIFDLIQDCPTPDAADYYAHRIDQLARRRTAISHLERGLQRLRNPGQDHDVDEILNRAADELTSARDNLANPPAPSTWAPVDLDGVLKGEYLDPPPTMLRRTDGVPLLYDGGIHTISGESESGKTWFALMAVLQLLEEQQNAIFLDFEDRADRVVGRLLALGAHPDNIRTHFAYIRPDRPIDDTARNALAPHLEHCRLVIVDGVTEAMTMHGYDLNSNADAALFYDHIPRWIADHGPAVVMIDHVVKDQEKQGRFALGAQHKLAGIDGVAYLVKMLQPFARGRQGLARINIGKDRPGHVRENAHGNTIAEFSLDASRNENVLLAHLTPPGELTGRRGDNFEPTILMERISRYVQANPGASKQVIIDVQNGKTPTKRLALELLVNRGYIGVKSGSRGAIQHFHIKPYYADGDPEEEAQDDQTN